MPAVDIIMPNGQWVYGVGVEQDIVNYVNSGSDVYDQAGKKLTIISAGGGIMIANQGGPGPMGSVTISEYLGSSAPREVIADTNGVETIQDTAGWASNKMLLMGILAGLLLLKSKR